MAHPLWPLFDLRIRSEHLVLRLPTDDELVDLAALARSGIHGEDEMPFGITWTTRPSPEFEIGFCQHHWLMRATWTPEKWWLNLAVQRDGEFVGAQTIAAEGFAVHHAVDTGSWVARRFQRQGIGKEMRGAVLAFAFDHLGADVAESEAFLDNAASNAVSQSLGYEPNGFGRLAPEGVSRQTAKYRMTRAVWRRGLGPPSKWTAWTAVAPCSGFDGLEAAAGAPPAPPAPPPQTPPPPLLPRSWRAPIVPSATIVRPRFRTTQLEKMPPPRPCSRTLAARPPSTPGRTFGSR